MYSIIGDHLKLVLADEPQIKPFPAASGMGRLAALIYQDVPVDNIICLAAGSLSRKRAS